MTRFVGQGAGKLILTGEHAVVYGWPALAIAVDRGVKATIEATDGPTHAVAGTPDDPRLKAALIQALGREGWRVTLESDLPLGRGMGSSAAIAVALVRARAAAEQRSISPDDVFELAFSIERIFHGTPSGLDHAVSSRGGLLRYVKGPPPHFTPLPCPRLTLVVLDSGSAGNTKDMVDQVRKQGEPAQRILARIGALVPQVEAALNDGPALGALLTQNHALLRELGVSSDRLDQLVQLALDAGAWGAKLAGAGGGGVVIALCADPAPLLASAAQHHIDAFICTPAPPCEVQ
ncbi:MAG: mevalonate kinase [Myxococcota bacterium]